MTVKAKLMLGLLLGFCALACLGTYHRTFISNALTFGHEQAGPQQSPSTHQELRGNRAKTKRVDLGDGLELIETAESKNDEVSSRHVKVTRGGETVLTCSSVTQLGKGIRTYYHDGKEVVSEILDKEAGVEMLILVGTDRMPIEVFERKKDGTVLPVGSDRLAEIKKGVKLISKTFGPVAEAAMKGTDEQEMRRLVGDAVRKARKAGQQPSADEKNLSK